MPLGNMLNLMLADAQNRICLNVLGPESANGSSRARIGEAAVALEGQIVQIHDLGTNTRSDHQLL